MATDTKASIKTSLQIGDVLITWPEKNGSTKKVKVTETKSGQDYLIEGKKIKEVDILDGYEIVVFKTSASTYYRNMNNDMVPNSDSWSDYFYEPITSSFYRKDKRGLWYDIQGFRIQSTVILKDHVLISLNGKVASANMLFYGHELYSSHNQLIIQVGKSVLDQDLQPVYYFSDKITGLGTRSVVFEDGIIYQEVKLSMNDYVFINEVTKSPIVINGDSIKSYDGVTKIGNNKYHKFNSNTSTYLLNIKTHKNLELNDAPHDIDESTYLKIVKDEIISIKMKSDSYYINMKTALPYFLNEYPDKKIRKIKNSNVLFSNHELVNVELDDVALVLNSNTGQVLKLPSDIMPEKINNIPGFENQLALVFLAGKSYLYSLVEKKIIEVGTEQYTIQSVDGYHTTKLINARDQNGRKVVLDLREGYTNVRIAESYQRVVSQMIGSPHNIGSRVLQNAKIETLGGTQRRVIDLNDPELAEFTFPHDMKLINEGEGKSTFSLTPLLSIDFDKVIKIGKLSFYTGLFRSYDEELNSVILQRENGKPLHLEGSGHKNELVTGFSPYTKKTRYSLGPYRMIGVTTLREDLKPNEILFALELMSSWIPFYDSYLPIFKKIVPLKGKTIWEYNLFELGEVSTDKEYIAVEKKAPYRILIQKKAGKRIPKVVKSSEKILKSPEEISMIKKLFFEDPGVLEEL